MKTLRTKDTTNRIVSRCVATAITLTLLATATWNAHAIPFTGSISFAGQVTPLDSGSSINSDLTQTASLHFALMFVAGSSGSFAGLTTLPATFSDLDIDPFSPASPLWSVVTPALNTYSFDLASLTIDYQATHSLSLSGLGTLHDSALFGYEDTPGDWVLTLNSSGSGANATFSFSAGTSALPDSGNTIILLGSVLLGLTLVKGRKFAHAVR
jgi:hypothetical protein